MLRGFLTPWRLKWYSVSILFALFVGFIISILSGSGSNILTGRLGGDFPAFYSTGRLILKGDWHEIYDRGRQIAEQKYLMGDENTYLPFSYPPYVALVYAPLSFLPFRFAYIIHTAMMALSLLLTLHLIRPMSEQLDKHFMCAFTLSASFYPIFKAITGGQNTSITLLLIALSWKAVSQNREYLAGVYTGLMLFKPQFALPLTGVYLLSGRWRLGISFGVVAIIFYIIGATIIGPDWITAWIENAKWQVQMDSAVNKEYVISWLSFFETIFGAGNPKALIIGWVLTGLTVIGISLIWFIGGRKSDLTAQLGLICVCLVLIPPRVLFYDAGVLLFAHVAICTRQVKRKIEILGLIWLISWSQTAADLIGFSPLFFLTISSGVLAAHTLLLPALKPVNK
jgi:hypothetical protein